MNWSVRHMDISMYRMVKNIGGKKLWRIWQIISNSPKFFSPIFTAFNRMGDIHYSRIRDTFALSPCAVGFALRNVREIYFLQMALGVFSVFVVH